MSELTALSSAYSTASLATDYSMAVVKKVMDTQDLAAQEMTRMLSESQNAVPAPLRKGQFIDVYA